MSMPRSWLSGAATAPGRRYGDPMSRTPRRAVARLYWRLSRWTLRTEPAPQESGILVGAPHTSNWDFVLMLVIAWELGIDVRWLGKHTLFRGWRGPVMRALGGIPVDRRDPGGVVADVVERVGRGEVFHLVVTPEGTRSGSGWKSGFYRIAREASLPVTLGYVDRTTMTTGLGPTLRLTGDVRADMDAIRTFYADKAGVNPALRTEPRLHSEE
jgi:1-acyl-sn-glycerol-3-phosphate acyltransferase